MRQILTILLLSIFLFVYGQTEKKYPIDLELKKCLNYKEHSTTQKMTDCVIKATDSWDKELNKNYNTLLSILTDEQKEKLKESQKQWIKFRDNELEFSGYFYNKVGGTMWIPVAAQTGLDITRNRALVLLEYISTWQQNKK